MFAMNFAIAALTQDADTHQNSQQGEGQSDCYTPTLILHTIDHGSVLLVPELSETTF